MKIGQGEVHVYMLDAKNNKADFYYYIKELLASYLGVATEELIIERNDRGKPILAGKHANKLYFNITHTSDKLLAAVATEPVGIDMERLGRKIEYNPILKRYFTDVEREDFANAAKEANACPTQVFLKGWTRKEAILKAAGIGLGGMRDYEISFSKPKAKHVKKQRSYPVRELLLDEDYWTTVSLLGERINEVRLFNFEKR
jgi:phosphopantetheine--protein transferase-like protein